jgi:hypothetical protein
VRAGAPVGAERERESERESERARDGDGERREREGEQPGPLWGQGRCGQVLYSGRPDDCISAFPLAFHNGH